MAMDLEQVGKQMGTLADEKAGVTQQLKEVEDKLKTVEDKLKTVEDKLKTVEDKLKTVEDKLETVKDKEERNFLLSKELALQNQLASLQNQRASLQNQRASLQNQLASLQNQLASLQNQRASLQNQLATLLELLKENRRLAQDQVAAAGLGAGSTGAGGSEERLLDRMAETVKGSEERLLDRMAEAVKEAVQPLEIVARLVPMMLRLQLIPFRYTDSNASKRPNNRPFKISLIRAYGDDEDQKVVQLLEDVPSTSDATEPEEDDPEGPASHASGGACGPSRQGPRASSASTSISTVQVTTLTLRCMVTGLRLPQNVVIAAHLVPHKMHAQASVAMEIPNINDVRNGLLWCTPVEAAFSDSRICFAPCGSDAYRLHVLDSDWLNKQLTSACAVKNKVAKELLDQVTWKQLDGKEIIFTSTKLLRPFARALLFQAEMALIVSRDRQGQKLLPEKEVVVREAWACVNQPGWGSPGAKVVADWLANTESPDPA